MFDGYGVVRRQSVSAWLSAAAYIGGLTAGLAIAGLILVAIGVPAAALADEFFSEAFLTSEGLSQTLTAAVPLILVGLAATLAARVRFWNIGIEGQLWLGAVAGTAVAVNNVGPPPARLALMLVAAMLAGAAWIAVPLLLKLALNVSEVLSTLLLGNIAFYLVQHLLFGVWRDPANNFPISRPFDTFEQLPALGWGELHAGLWISLAAVLIAWAVLGSTRLGFYAKAVGLNPTAARATGVPVVATTVLLVLGSGALCGLAGIVILAGTEHRLTQSIGAGYLFSGIAIAFLARAQPLATVAVAVVVGGIATAGEVLKVLYSVSEAAVVLVQGTVLMTVLMAQFFSAYRVTRVTWGGAP